MGKVDFTVDAKEDDPFQSVSVGQILHLEQQENGIWTCSREDGSLVCEVPGDAASSLQASQGGSPVATIRSVKRSTSDPSTATSIQVRITFTAAGQQAPPLQQAPAPADDPAGFTLTTAELEQLAYNQGICTTLGDKRLQDVLLKIDGAANREQALNQALENPDFREFADKMLHVMKPSQYPPS